MKKPAAKSSAAAPAFDYRGQVVLVFEGGGALGAYQVGVYEALHEAGIEPDWVVGTSIGAINGAIIAGNKREDRLAKLDAFWSRVQQPDLPFVATRWAQETQALGVMAAGVDGFFRPNYPALLDARAHLGTYDAAYYSTEPLARTLEGLVDLKLLNDAKGMRISLGAVNVLHGRMRYFDSRADDISIASVMASGALPPAFPPVKVDGEPYWDGGLYSNTPVEAVMNDMPRRDSLIFTAHLWHSEGPAPTSVWETMGRQKEIQFASRLDGFIEEERKLHRLRHLVHMLGERLPAAARKEAEVKEMLSWGCSTTMHLCRLYAPRLPGEDQTKDIDFSARGIAKRRRAGYLNTRKMLKSEPWKMRAHPFEGVVVHGRPDEVVKPE